MPDIDNIDNNDNTGSTENAGNAEATPPADKPAKKAVAKKAGAKKATAKKSTAKKATAKKAAATAESTEQPDGGAERKPAKKAASKKGAAKKTTKKAAEADSSATDAVTPLFQAPEPTAPAKKATARRTSTKKAAATAGADAEKPESTDTGADSGEQDGDSAEESGEGGTRRRRRRGGRRRRKPGEGGGSGSGADGDGDESDDGDESGDQGEGSGQGQGSSRRRTRVRTPRSAEDQITAVSGSTRLEAKKQRRREGREAGRRRAPIVSEAEFLARREAVARVMVIRQRGDLSQIGVLEDKVLVEHYVARESQTSLIGNVYLGRVQNVLPSMEAAFIDIGRGRNAVLYAGEVNWSALGQKDGQPRKIESVLSSGQAVLVQVSKDPVGHKGARLTSQISLAGRFLVYVPDGTTSGISRKLPDTERNRLKTLLKEIVPDTAGVIVRTAAEGASEDELTRDVERLKARWEDIEAKTKGNAPQLLYGEPDLTLKVVRDLFTEDFTKLVIQGADAWETVQGYVQHVAPDLEERLERYDPADHSDVDLFSSYRVDEQIAKGLDRKVWLPSGGSLVIDRTEAMTVVDVNTGKFTGSGGNLEETVTKNNLEAAEEIVRQLRLRDIGGIIVVDFIDMVLESNRDLVLRRLVECLGRDRTRHQVAEVTSLGLVQMTRKRIGTGLLEAFSETCEDCGGRGLVMHDMPVEQKRGDDGERRGGRRGRGGRGRAQGSDSGNGNGNGNGGRAAGAPSPKTVAAMARHENAVVDDDSPTEPPVDESPEIETTEPEATAPETTEPETAEDLEVPERDAVIEAPAAGLAETTEPAVVEPAETPTVDVDPAPRVVTRSRRRSASRPAGPPTGTDGTAPDPVPALEPALNGMVEPGTVVAEPGGVAPEQPPVVEHVPVKRKGSRKR